MTIEITAVSNPRWVNAEHTMIDCEIKVASFGDEVLPFTASATDVETHGRQLFQEISAGKYGVIAEYVPPPEPVLPAPDQEQPLVEGANPL